MDTPKNIHIALVKKEDIEKDKTKRIIKNTKEWEELKNYINLHIYDERKKEIFQVMEVQSKKILRKDNMFSSEYWEIDYSGVVGLAKGKGRRVYSLYNMDYEVLRKQRLAFMELLDEFEEWGIIKKKET